MFLENNFALQRSYFLDDFSLTKQRPVKLRNKQTILLIEDDPDQLVALSILLRKSGFQVITSQTVDSGLEVLHLRNVDCVICDVMMPGKNGVQFLELVRSLDYFYYLPVIMLTAAGAQMEFELISRGADLFCLKQDARNCLIPQVRFLLN